MFLKKLETHCSSILVVSSKRKTAIYIYIYIKKIYISGEHEDKGKVDDYVRHIYVYIYIYIYISGETLKKYTQLSLKCYRQQSRTITA